MFVQAAGLGADDLISSAMVVVALATLAGMGYFRGTVTNLRSEIAEVRSQRDDARKDRDEAQLDRDKYKADLDALTRVVTGEVHWVAIGEKLDEHNDRAEIHWQQDEALLKEIRDILLRRAPE